MKRGTWFSTLPGVISLSIALTLELFLSNWTAFVLLRWHAAWWFLSIAAFALILFFILNKWFVAKFEVLHKREQNALLIAMGVYSLFVFLNQFPAYQSTFMTWATLILAGTAAIGIVASMDQVKRNERLRIKDREENERIRKEDREENERIRKEDREENRRLIAEQREHALKQYEEAKLHESRRSSLNTLHNWAQEAFNFLEEKHPTNTLEELHNLWQMASILRLQAINLHSLGLIFDEDFAKTVRTAMDNFVEYHSKIFTVAQASTWGSSIPETEQDSIKQAGREANISTTNLLTSTSLVRVKYKL